MANIKGKLPKDAVSADEFKPKKGFVTGQQSILGDLEITYASPAEPDKYFYQNTRASGSYQTVQIDSSKKEIQTCLAPGEERMYTGGGKSCQIDGHSDTNSESTIRTNSAGDIGVSGLTRYAAYKRGEVKTVEGFKKDFTVGITGLPGSTKTFVGTYGDHVNEHSGNWHEGFEKDHVSGVSGNKITMVGGDYAIHAQKGNYDVHVAQRGRMFSTGPMLIESATLLTLKVGASTIVIGPASIRMISPRIDLN